MNYRVEVICAVLIFAFAVTTSSAGTYKEIDQGDFSNNGTSPTSLLLADGSNPVYGTTGKVTTMDRDYFTFTIPTGSVLESIELLPGTTVGGSATFFGLQAGKQVTVSVNASTAAGLLGWTHYSTSDIGKNLLIAMGPATNGSTGFTPPLAAGDYSIWLQDFGPGAVSYGLDFKVTSIPEPASSAWLCMLGACSLQHVLRRRNER